MFPLIELFLDELHECHCLLLVLVDEVFQQAAVSVHHLEPLGDVGKDLFVVLLGLTLDLDCVLLLILLSLGVDLKGLLVLDTFASEDLLVHQS